MVEKELKKLNRTELLELLIAQSKENETIRAENAELHKQVDDKLLVMNETGSIAEASLRLSGVFEAAQAAAEQYLSSIENMKNKCEDIQRSAEYSAGVSVSTAEEKANLIVYEAEKQAERIVTEAEAKAALLEKTSKEKADSYWHDVSGRLEAFYDDHKGLRELLQSSGFTFAK